ncbi:DUF2085 domain-containing protein [Neobacillus cucumis]|uniref:DUF2085 domain-containing protein n=1 Tax=Neobacillus cucumis TaxID=1740721 RepID=UPI0019634B36|nr:DUF2085 domain-containing protein [Neobacillus cucumis]MBM7652044.1 putative membrane protein [Neobacillus cucumis]
MIHELLQFFGKAICHQIEDRSLLASGKTLSVCARDTGIYLGIFSTFIYLFLLKRNQIITIPSIKVSFFLLLFMVPMMIDGLGSYAHLFESNNERRLLTGLGFGFVLPFFMFPLIFGNALDPRSKPVIKNTFDILIPMFFCCLLGSLVYWNYITYYMIDSLIIFTIVIWFSLWTSLLFTSIRNSFLKWLFSIMSSLAFLSILSLLHSYILP